MCVVSLQAYHFDRDDVALPGFHKFMLKQSDEEREHARKVKGDVEISAPVRLRHVIWYC